MFSRGISKLLYGLYTSSIHAIFFELLRYVRETNPN